MVNYTKKLNRPKWLIVDLDGTLAETIYPRRGIGKPIASMVEALGKASDNGMDVCIFTSRHWDDYQNIEQWLKDNNISYRMIVCGKPLGAYYIDDKALLPEEFIKWAQK